MSYRVLIPEKIAKDGVEFLKQCGYEVKDGRGLDKQKLIEDLQDCDAVIVRVCVIDEEVFERCPRLKVVAGHGVGVDNIDLESAKRHGCRVTNTPTANSVAVAEHAIMLMLALAKNLFVFAVQLAMRIVFSVLYLKHPETVRKLIMYDTAASLTIFLIAFMPFIRWIFRFL